MTRIVPAADHRLRAAVLLAERAQVAVLSREKLGLSPFCRSPFLPFCYFAYHRQDPDHLLIAQNKI